METVLVSPFDILFRNFFDSRSNFNVLEDVKIPHPVNILETKDGLVFEIACTGLSKDQVEINIEHDVLRVSHNKEAADPSEYEDRNYLVRGITKKAFNLGYKVASRFNLSKADAIMENGLLIITVPFAPEAQPKTLQIK